MKEITYTCKFCRHGCTFEVNWDEACEQFDLSKWIPILVCDRCGNHERKRRDIESSIIKLAIQIVVDRRALRGPALLKAEAAARECLNVKLMAYATCICDHLFIQTQFDNDFTDQIVEKPDKAHKLLAFYRSSIIRIARDTHASLPA